MKKDPFSQIIRKWAPKGVFVDLLKKYLGMNIGFWSRVGVWTWIYENFWGILWCFWKRKCVKLYLLLWVLHCYFYWVIKVLLWSVFYYHGMLVYLWQIRKGLVVYDFYSWQINLFSDSSKKKLFTINSLVPRYFPNLFLILYWFWL